MKQDINRCRKCGVGIGLLHKTNRPYYCKQCKEDRHREIVKIRYYSIWEKPMTPEEMKKKLMSNKLRVEIMYRDCFETPKITSVLKFYDEEIRKIDEQIKKNNEVFQ